MEHFCNKKKSKGALIKCTCSGCNDTIKFEEELLEGQSKTREGHCSHFSIKPLFNFGQGNLIISLSITCQHFLCRYQEHIPLFDENKSFTQYLDTYICKKCRELSLKIEFSLIDKINGDNQNGQRTIFNVNKSNNCMGGAQTYRQSSRLNIHNGYNNNLNNNQNGGINCVNQQMNINQNCMNNNNNMNFPYMQMNSNNFNNNNYNMNLNYNTYNIANNNINNFYGNMANNGNFCNNNGMINNNNNNIYNANFNNNYNKFDHNNV